MHLNKDHARKICPSVEYVGVHSAKSIKLGDKNVIDPTVANIIMEILENTISPQCGNPFQCILVTYKILKQ